MFVRKSCFIVYYLEYHAVGLNMEFNGKNHVWYTYNIGRMKILVNFYIGISIPYVGPRNTRIYDNEEGPRMSQEMLVAPPNQDIRSNPFVGTKMSAFAATKTTFWGTRDQKIGVAWIFDNNWYSSAWIGPVKTVQ